MVTTSARLLRLLSLLQSRRVWPGGELGRTLGITGRSVRRDVERLRSLGYPVHAAAGPGGGYQLGAGKELPPLPLEDDEAVAVSIGLRAAASGPVRGLEDASLRALGKLEQVLPKRLRRRVNALSQVSVTLREWDGGVDAEVLALLAAACRDAELLRFSYRDHAGAPTSRAVEPYRLVHTSFRWYLLAFDQDRDDWRVFRVDRVEKPRPGLRFSPRPLPANDVAAYVSRKISSDAYKHRAVITVQAPARELRRFVAALSGHVEELDSERSRVRTGGASLDALAFHLGTLPFDFVVHEPEALKVHLRAMAKRLSRAAR